MTTTQPLVPIHACPWCNPNHAGLAPRVNTANGTQHWVFCPECGMHGPCGIGEAEAIERWNAVCSRTPSVLPGAGRERLASEHVSVAEMAGMGPVPMGSSVCPICGLDTPHYHSPEVVSEYYNKVNSASMKQIKGVMDAAQEICKLTIDHEWPFPDVIADIIAKHLWPAFIEQSRAHELRKDYHPIDTSKKHPTDITHQGPAESPPSSVQAEAVGELREHEGRISFHTLVPLHHLKPGLLYAAPIQAPGIVAEGSVMVPIEPTEEQWGGLARAIVMWMDMSDGPKLPRDLLKHLERSGQEIPQWLRDEPEMQMLDHSMSKGSRAVLIYKAMLSSLIKAVGEKP